ncbi:ABC-type branched-subunit amino acid transport system substrate-binding protein [Rhodoligotrophos appendicifer]|uniref:ABC transporter substrate-binding protein n=1 Tax=Rhodoligotrophos appendicifer TaxID=987056 RepID=UPI001185CCFB|nr:ABC transporter substrate-binding protein [Rhodoligotrophos appendicifer]
MSARRSLPATLAGIIAAGIMATSAQAEDPYKIGISAGLTGYAATVDRAWSDGVQTAVEVVNANGGVLGRQLMVTVEDNRSEPQDSVTVYRKMISDGVNIFISGCVSAGNMAAAPQVVRAETPMMLCSILPKTPKDVEWAFTTLPPARFEVETRLQYLKDKTQIKKIGVMHDPSPYANLQKDVAAKIAKDYGLEIVGIEQYKTNDADLSVIISKMNAAGAGAILKIGLGGTTLTAAKNIKQLGLDMLLLTSLEDLAVFRPVAEVLGDKFFFVASPSQVYDALPQSPLKDEIGEFLGPWKKKFADRDPNWASRGWDGVMLTVAAIEKGQSVLGPDVRNNLETISGYQGTTGIYNFSAQNHQGITENPFVLGQIIGGQVKVVE